MVSHRVVLAPVVQLDPERATFADIGQTVAEFLGAAPLESGTSFLGEVWDA